MNALVGYKLIAHCFCYLLAYLFLCTWITYTIDSGACRPLLLSQFGQRCTMQRVGVLRAQKVEIDAANPLPRQPGFRKKP